MYTCIYTHVYTYIYIYTHTCICIYIHTYVCVRMYIYVCVYTCVHVYIYIHVFLREMVLDGVFLRARVLACACVSVCLSLSLCRCLCLWTYLFLFGFDEQINELEGSHLHPLLFLHKLITSPLHACPLACSRARALSLLPLLPRQNSWQQSQVYRCAR